MHTNEERASINIQSNCSFYRCIIYEKIGVRFSIELWWLTVGGLVESKKVFKLVYHQDIGTAVLSELFRIALSIFSW